MNKLKKKKLTFLKKKKFIRAKISGTESRPRLSIFRSLMHVSLQAIDDVNGKTLTSSSTLANDLKIELSGKKVNIETSKIVGKDLGEKLKKLGIKEAVFDRNGYVYHGKIKAVADGVREAGIKM